MSVVTCISVPRGGTVAIHAAARCVQHLSCGDVPRKMMKAYTPSGVLLIPEMEKRVETDITL